MTGSGSTTAATEPPSAATPAGRGNLSCPRRLTSDGLSPRRRFWFVVRRFCCCSPRRAAACSPALCGRAAKSAFCVLLAPLLADSSGRGLPASSPRCLLLLFANCVLVVLHSLAACVAQLHCPSHVPHSLSWLFACSFEGRFKAGKKDGPGSVFFTRDGAFCVLSLPFTSLLGSCLVMFVACSWCGAAACFSRCSCGSCFSSCGGGDRPVLLSGAV